MKLEQLLKEWILENHAKTDKLEGKYAELNELKIDDLNSYPYQETEHMGILGSEKAWTFEDRCGNQIVAVYLDSTGEFKSGFKIEQLHNLVFDPRKLPQDHPKFGNMQTLIKPCPDDKRVNTVYKILLDEVIPNFLLNKKPNQLHFNPVSDSRNRLVDIIINKVIEKYPQLTKKGNYLIYM